MERVEEEDGSDNAPWRLVEPEVAVSRIAVVARTEEDVPDAQKALEELRGLFASGQMFMAENVLGRMFMGSLDETQEFVASHGGWATPCNAH